MRRLIKKLLFFIIRSVWLRKFKVVKKYSSLPKEGFLILSTHFNRGEVQGNISHFWKYDLYPIAGYYSHRKSIFGYFCQLIGCVFIPESLSHLSANEQKRVITRIPIESVRNRYLEIISNDKIKAAKTHRVDAMKKSVDLLIAGKSVLIMPEGLFLYEESNSPYRTQSLYKGQKGFVYIAQAYKNRTGKDLSIVPVANYKNKNRKHLIIGAPFTLPHTIESVDHALSYGMKKLADLLPQQYRGYYQ